MVIPNGGAVNAGEGVQTEWKHTHSPPKGWAALSPKVQEDGSSRLPRPLPTASPTAGIVSSHTQTISLFQNDDFAALS